MLHSSMLHVIWNLAAKRYGGVTPAYPTLPCFPMQSVFILPFTVIPCMGERMTVTTTVQTAVSSTTGLCTSRNETTRARTHDFHKEGARPKEGPQPIFKGPSTPPTISFRAMKGTHYTAKGLHYIAKGPYYPSRGPLPPPEEPKLPNNS